MSDAECREAQELMPWWPEGDLTLEERRVLATHTAQCDACRGELVATLALRQRLAVAVEGLAGATPWERVAGRLPEAESPRARSLLQRMLVVLDEIAGGREMAGALRYANDVTQLAPRVQVGIPLVATLAVNQ